MIKKKLIISKTEFEEMLELAETNETMRDALEQTKLVYELLQTPEQKRNKEKIRKLLKALEQITPVYRGR